MVRRIFVAGKVGIMEIKKHYKLYKKGKTWCTLAIAVGTLGVGILSTQALAHADQTEISSTNEHSNVSANSTVESTVTNSTDTVALRSSASESNASGNLNSADKSVVDASSSSETQSVTDDKMQSSAEASNSSESTGSRAQSQPATEDKVQSSIETSNTSESSAVSANTEDTSTLASNAAQSDEDVLISDTTTVDGARTITRALAVSVSAQQLKNGLVTENGNTYFYKNGTKQSGTQTINGKTYYFDSATKQMQKNYFLHSNSKVYYFDKSGIEYRD